MTRINSNFHWWQTGVVYQIYPRSFKDATGNGIGDLQGILDKLDHLNGAKHSLGIDAIWISPFYPSPMADFGYDVADYRSVHPMFGDIAAFDRLLEEAHKRRIKVIIDYVPNHTSNQHPWFLESRRTLDNPKRDWYIWRDPNPDGSLPNNWGAVFGGPAWEWDETTGQYYFHQFLKEQPDLNWRNPEVRTAMLDVLRFWLDRGVDGFRMDVVGMILKDPQMRDNPPNPDAPPDISPDDIFASQLNIHNQDQDEVHEIMRAFRHLLNQYKDRCAIGELWYELPRWIKYYGQNGDGLHLPFNFRLMHQPWTASAIRQSVEELEAALPDFTWPNYVLGNHDQERLASRVGRAQARVAAMLLLTLRGTPTLYYGDELGLENGVIPPEGVKDPQGKRFGAKRNRDVARTPMQWDNSPNAGFSSTEPWLPVSTDHAFRNVEAQNKDALSMLNLHRALLRLRRNSLALQIGSYRTVAQDNGDCFTYLRAHETEQFLIALNFEDQACSISLFSDQEGSIELSTHLDREEQVSLSNLYLRPNEGVIIRMPS